MDKFPVEYDLNINIEKELDKITQNIPLTELIKIPSVKNQVIEFFDSLPIVSHNDSIVEPPSQSTFECRDQGRRGSSN